jgi:PEP-CTERM motif
VSASIFKRSALVFAIAMGVAAAAQAALITSGFTFAVASAGGATATGTHYHSNTGGAFGNPAGKAEVGRFGTEEVRGLSEYNLTGLGLASSAFVTFDIFKKGGLFNGTNDTPFTGTVIVEAYAGNNLENISDYQAASLGQVGTFAIDPLTYNVGDIFSFDITSFFNDVVNSGGTSLGIRLRESTAGADYALSKAWTFEDFRLTSDNQCTGAACGIPEPGSLALVGLALLAAGMARRRS